MTEVLAISSHVVRGRVGLRAIAPALEAFGVTAHLLPTVMMPWHPGHGPSSRVPNNDLPDLLDDISRAPWIKDVSAILTGYFASVEQVVATANFIARRQANNSNLIYLCDPVMGDRPFGTDGKIGDGQLYVSDEVAEAIRDRLVPLADIITPNAFELGWLAEMDIIDVETAAHAGLVFDPPVSEVFCTSVPAKAPGLLSLMLGEYAQEDAVPPNIRVADHELLAKAPNGTGDLLSAVYLALRLIGQDAGEALAQTTFVMREIVFASSHVSASELPIEKYLAGIVDALFSDEDEEDDEEFEGDTQPLLH